MKTILLEIRAGLGLLDLFFLHVWTQLWGLWGIPSGWQLDAGHNTIAWWGGIALTSLKVLTLQIDVFIDLESWYKLATQGAGQLRWRPAVEERRDWSGGDGSIGRNPSFYAAFFLAPGQRQTSLELVRAGSFCHDEGGDGVARCKRLIEANLCCILWGVAT